MTKTFGISPIFWTLNIVVITWKLKWFRYFSNLDQCRWYNQTSDKEHTCIMGGAVLRFYYPSWILAQKARNIAQELTSETLEDWQNNFTFPIYLHSLYSPKKRTLCHSSSLASSFAFSMPFFALSTVWLHWLKDWSNSDGGIGPGSE